MKVAILTMFAGLSSTYSLVNVVADQLQMLLDAGIAVKMLVSENCPDRERTGIFSDPVLQWVKITNTLDGQPIHWRDYSAPTGSVHPTFHREADAIARDFVRHLQDVDVCILHDILYQGWHLVHNVALRKAQKQLPQLRFLSFTHSLPVPAAGNHGRTFFRPLYPPAQYHLRLSYPGRPSCPFPAVRCSIGPVRRRI